MEKLRNFWLNKLTAKIEKVEPKPIRFVPKIYTGGPVFHPTIIKP